MSEPEIQPDAGTGEGVVNEDSPANGQGTDTPAGDPADGGEPSNGENGQDAAGSRVPYDRFYKVNEARKTAELENAELKARLKAFEPKPPEPTPEAPGARLKKILKPAPSDWQPLEQMEYYGLETLRNHPEVLDEWFESKFGMKPDAAAATLSHATVSTRDQIVTQFNDAAKAHGLDPKNERVRLAVGALMDTGKFSSFHEAMATFRPAQATTKPKQPSVNGRGAEVDSIDLTGLSTVRVMPKDAAEAMRLASQGKRTEYVSVTDILKATQAKA